MSQMTNFMENAMVDHWFRARQHTAPATIKVSLYTAAPGEAGGGTKVSGGSYAPVSITTSDAAFDATQGGNSGASSGTGGATQNSAAATFPVPSANWGTVTHMSLDDASDNALMYAGLAASKNINNGDPAPSFPIGAIDVVFA